jgi:hypothetical protein
MYVGWPEAPNDGGLPEGGRADGAQVDAHRLSRSLVASLRAVKGRPTTRLPAVDGRLAPSTRGRGTVAAAIGRAADVRRPVGGVAPRRVTKGAADATEADEGFLWWLSSPFAGCGAQLGGDRAPGEKNGGGCSAPLFNVRKNLLRGQRTENSCFIASRLSGITPCLALGECEASEVQGGGLTATDIVAYNGFERISPTSRPSRSVVVLRQSSDSLVLKS